MPQPGSLVALTDECSSTVHDNLPVTRPSSALPGRSSFSVPLTTFFPTWRTSSWPWRIRAGLRRPSRRVLMAFTNRCCPHEDDAAASRSTGTVCGWLASQRSQFMAGQSRKEDRNQGRRVAKGALGKELYEHTPQRRWWRALGGRPARVAVCPDVKTTLGSGVALDTLVSYQMKRTGRISGGHDGQSGRLIPG